MDKALEIGTLIHFRGSIGIVVGHDWTNFSDGQEPENWIQVYWHEDSKTTWEEWETNMDLFEVIG